MTFFLFNCQATMDVFSGRMALRQTELAAKLILEHSHSQQPFSEASLDKTNGLVEVSWKEMDDKIIDDSSPKGYPMEYLVTMAAALASLLASILRTTVLHVHLARL